MPGGFGRRKFKIAIVDRLVLRNDVKDKGEPPRFLLQTRGESLRRSFARGPLWMIQQIERLRFTEGLFAPRQRDREGLCGELLVEETRECSRAGQAFVLKQLLFALRKAMRLRIQKLFQKICEACELGRANRAF